MATDFPNCPNCNKRLDHSNDNNFWCPYCGWKSDHIDKLKGNEELLNNLVNTIYDFVINRDKYPNCDFRSKLENDLRKLLNSL